MRLADILGNALANLRRRKVRTVLTSIGVFVGILTIVTMVSAGIGAQQQITSTLSGLGLETIIVTPPYGNQSTPITPLTPAMMQRIAGLPHVASISPQLDMPRQIADARVAIAGKTAPFTARADNGLRVNPLVGGTFRILAGRDFDAEHQRGAVVSADGLRSLGLASDAAGYQAMLGQPITLTISDPRGDERSFSTTIIGVDSNTNINDLQLPFTAPATNRDVSLRLGNETKLAVRQWWFHRADILDVQGYDRAEVKADSIPNVNALATSIHDEMHFDTDTVPALIDQVSRVFTILQVLLTAVGLLALLVASIGIANTMVMAIYERTREIGILKALGASGGNILSIFMLEASFIGLLGGIFGVIGGWLLDLLLNYALNTYLDSQNFSVHLEIFQVNLALILGALGFAALIGLLAGLAPARRAARLDPLAALRHE